VVIPEKSQIGLLHSERVLLFSNIFPALISLRSFTVLGPFSLSVELRGKGKNTTKLLGRMRQKSTQENSTVVW
jgi:hypothetical protein